MQQVTLPAPSWGAPGPDLLSPHPHQPQTTPLVPRPLVGERDITHQVV